MVGFTLLEITIVLAVIGLIAAGVLLARSMIRTSQLQATITESQVYATAIKNFKDKYKALPGDFSTATTIWGEVSASCAVGVGTGTTTCNGNGDGNVRYGSGAYENFLAWRHLGLSGFTPQNFTGNTVTGGVCNYDFKAGENVPASRVKGGAWNFETGQYATAYTGSTGTMYFPISQALDTYSVHALWLGASLQDDTSTDSCSHSQIPLLTGSEAFELDRKYDDGSATTGAIRHQYNNGNVYNPCEDAATTGGYKKNTPGVNCSLVFIINP